MAHADTAPADIAQGSDMDSQAIGVGIVGFWHVHAEDYANQARENPLTRVVAGWDGDPCLASAGTSGLGIERSASLDALLADPRVEAVTVTTATSEHTDVIGRALDAGKHVFTEKLLAPTVAEAEALVDLARRRRRALVVSLPQLSVARTVAVRRLVREGALGRVTYARVRMAHDGWLGGWLPERFADPATAVGGAFADLGCHPAYLVPLFLGSRPRTVSASFGAVTSRAVEDNAVVTMGWPDGALGVAEASFVTTPGAFAFEVRGTEASVLYGFGGDSLVGKGGMLGDEWSEIPLPAPEPSPFEQWVDAIRNGSDTTNNLAAAVELTRLVAAAAESAATGVVVTLEEDGKA